MGAKAWFAACYDGDPKAVLAGNPTLDRAASLSVAERLLPDARLEEMDDGNLVFLNPDKGEICVGVYGGLTIIAHEAYGGDRPSELDARWRSADLGSTIYVHATHSVVDWFAFAVWHGGTLVRALSAAPDNGVIEDIGDKQPFELEFLEESSGFDDEEDYPLPFHPLELSEAALLANLGFQFEGYPSEWVCEPENVPMMRFRIVRKPFWKFW